jgi:hypothetical protein
MPSSHAPARPRRALAALSALALVTTLAGSAAAAPGGQGNAGFKTSIEAMLMPGAQAPEGVVIEPLLTVGDTSKGFTFDSIPDGISFVRHGRGTVDLYVNHETSLVPFPGTLTDFSNSHVDKLRLNAHSAGLLAGSDAIPSDANYQRFCSNFLAGPEQGFDRQILFTNEEATDTVNRQGLAWPAPSSFGSQPEQAGVVVALDIKTGEFRTIYGMGRHNHENSVAIPGYDELVVLSGDDTFTAPASQMYSYIAADTDAVWDDEGALYAFKSNDPLTNDYGDLTVGESVAGTFILVPEAIAKGDQAGLENWSNEEDVFQFIRVEDIAYDRTDPRIVYFADTGEPRASNATSAGPGRLTREGSAFRGPYMNGRIFKMVLNSENPRQVDSLSVLIDADLLGYNNPLALHQPDNVETTANSILIQEDPGGHNQFALDDPNGVGARVWRYDLSSGTLEAVLEVDQSLDNRDGYDNGPALARNGGWESSGIIDASSIWGPGWFLVDIQAGTLILESEDGLLGDRPVTFEREGGQLLRVKIPGA